MKSEGWLVLATCAILGFASLLLFSCGGSDDDDDDDDAVSDDDEADDDIDDDADDDTVADDTADDTADDDSADDDTSGGEVSNPEQSACLSHEKITAVEEFVNLSFVDGTLHVEHLNTCRQCGLEFEGSFLLQGGDLTAIEADLATAPTNCDCDFNLTYEIPGIEAAAYDFLLKKSDSWSGEGTILTQPVDFGQQTDYQFSLGTHECG
jgi:hypothetical protein